MSTLTTKFTRLINKRSVKYGLPFFLIIIGGSFGLEQFSKIRYEFSKKSAINSEELKRHGVEMKKPGEVTLEGEYEKLQDMDIDNWEQVRGPRPWEENASN